MTLMNLAKAVAFSGVAILALSVSVEKAEAQPWWNPTIFDTGTQFQDMQYDPFTNSMIMRTRRTSVKASAMDPNRNWVDPGSKRWVNEIRMDAQGNQWRVRGWQWTSNGVPHGNLKRTRINQLGPGMIQQQEEQVFYSRRRPSRRQ